MKYKWTDVRGLLVDPQIIKEKLEILNKTEHEFLYFLNSDLPGYALSVLDHMATSHLWCKDYSNRQDPNVYSEKFRENVAKALKEQFNQKRI